MAAAAMSTSEVYLVAMLIIFGAPYFIWRCAGTNDFAPLVVVQIITGIVLGPGVLGAALPVYYKFVFAEPVTQALNGVAQWAVMVFVWIAGLELELRDIRAHWKETGVTAGLALSVPLAAGSLAASGMVMYPGWIGANASDWQFVLGVGMACAVTALPILVLFMEKLEILRQPIGQRILRYASVDDIAIWGVLAVIMMDWRRAGQQIGFLLIFALCAFLFRKLLQRSAERDRWYLGLIWLAACGLGADWSGLHYMVGAFLAGASMDSCWLDQKQIDALRGHVLLAIMPVFFLSTGLRTHFDAGGQAVFACAAILLAASVGGKLLGTTIAGKILGWKPGEALLIGWLLQTKALIVIIFATVLVDKALISSDTFSALVVMAVASTMLTIPAVTPRLAKMNALALRTTS